MWRLIIENRADFKKCWVNEKLKREVWIKDNREYEGEPKYSFVVFDLKKPTKDSRIIELHRNTLKEVLALAREYKKRMSLLEKRWKKEKGVIKNGFEKRG